MKKLPLLLLLCTILTQVSAQTTLDEYTYLTEGYAEQMDKGVRPEFRGYYLEDLLELTDKSGIVKLFYKNHQESMVPVATQFQIFSGNKIYYICVPHEESDKDIFNKYSEDLQSIFKESSNAQSIFSVLMVQYPIELQKFYDEILRLEKLYANEGDEMLAMNTNKGIEEPEISIKTPVKQPVVKEPTPKPSTKSVSNPAPVRMSAIEKPKEKADTETVEVVTAEPEVITIKQYTPEVKKEVLRATGSTKNELSTTLKKRNLQSRPELVNTTGKIGVVRMDICVDARGKVVSVRNNEKISTTRNKALLELSTKLAKKYVFSNSHLSRQCGYLIFTYE